MELEWLLAVVLFGILHWVLAIILLNDIAHRKQIKNEKKAPWILAIIFLVFIGSLLYLIFHPRFFFDSDDEDKNR